MSVESDLIGGTLDLQNSHVKEHCRPRDEILFYDIQEPISNLFELFVDKEITRVPVCDAALENLIGILGRSTTKAPKVNTIIKSRMILN